MVATIDKIKGSSVTSLNKCDKNEKKQQQKQNPIRIYICMENKYLIQ